MFWMGTQYEFNNSGHLSELTGCLQVTQNTETQKRRPGLSQTHQYHRLCCILVFKQHGVENDARGDLWTSDFKGQVFDNHI